jgi:glycosyltransferase 2 family protein
MSAGARRFVPFVRGVLIAALIGSVAFFFFRALKANWAQVQAHDFRLSYGWLLLAFGSAVGCSLLSTYAWQVALSGLSGRRDMTFSRSVATNNSTSLTKYLPGKFWSYALQMYWLSRSGYSKAQVLYVNLSNLIVSLLTGMVLAVALLLPTGRLPIWLVAAALGALLLLDVIYVRFHGPVLRLCARVLRRVLKRDLPDFDPPMSLLVKMHVIQFSAQLLSAAGGYVLCFAIGYELDAPTICLVMASLILADTAGFLFFLAPAGLGVREATMYFLLHGGSSTSLALVYPLASRALYMVADLLLGAVALILLRSSVGRAEAEQLASPPP